MNMRSLIGWLCLVALGAVLTVPVWADDDAKPAAQPAKMCCEQPQGMGMMAHRGPMCPAARCLLRVLLPWLAVIHVLLAMWVYSDIRRRGEGHGIFIVLALLGGIPATILYALVRIGDKKT